MVTGDVFVLDWSWHRQVCRSPWRGKRDWGREIEPWQLSELSRTTACWWILTNTENNEMSRCSHRAQSKSCINDSIDLQEAKRACSANMEMAGWILGTHPFHCKPLSFFRFFILDENFVNFSELSTTWAQQNFFASPSIERQNMELLSHQWAWSRRWRWRGGVGFRIAVSKEPQ